MHMFKKELITKFYGVNISLYNYVNQNIVKQYQNFDIAHNIDHINQVITNSLRISRKYSVNINMVFVIAAYHDLGIRYGRENHNITSASLLLEDVFLKKEFNFEEIKLMKEAVEDHRASNDYEPRTIYGKIISEADIDLDVERIFNRVISYENTYSYNLSEEEKIQRVYEHLKNKYGESGYLVLWLGSKKNAKGLKKIRKILENEVKFKKKYYCIKNKL